MWKQWLSTTEVKYARVTRIRFKSVHHNECWSVCFASQSRRNSDIERLPRDTGRAYEERDLASLRFDKNNSVIWGHSFLSFVPRTRVYIFFNTTNPSLISLKRIKKSSLADELSWFMYGHRSLLKGTHHVGRTFQNWAPAASPFPSISFPHFVSSFRSSVARPARGLVRS